MQIAHGLPMLSVYVAVCKFILKKLSRINVKFVKEFKCILIMYVIVSLAILNQAHLCYGWKLRFSLMKITY